MDRDGTRPVAGARLSWVFLTPDGRFWVHSYSRLLIDLYAVEGVPWQTVAFGPGAQLGTAC